jgi:hypothetical protein
MKPMDSEPNCWYFVVGVYTCAAAGGVSKVNATFGCLCQAIEPAQCVVDVFMLEAHSDKALGQDIGRGASLRGVVIFEEINEDVEHGGALRSICLHSQLANRQTSKLVFTLR